MAFLKEFPMREHVRLAFRAELHGAFNHMSSGMNGNDFSMYQNLRNSKATTPTVTQANIGGNRTIQLGMMRYS